MDVLIGVFAIALAISLVVNAHLYRQTKKKHSPRSQSAEVIGLLNDLNQGGRTFLEITRVDSERFFLRSPRS